MFAAAWRVVIAVGVLLAIGALAALLSARSVDAHSFLVATSPAQGERLATPPEAIVLDFSERVDPASATVAVRTADDRSMTVGDVELSGDGLEVRARAGGLGDGIYVVAWQALSAVDGHGTSGEFAFAVGNAAGAIPAPVTSSPTSTLGVVAAWLFFVGIALAAGALVLRAVAAGLSWSPGPMVVRTGVVTAMAGAAIELVRTDSDELLLLLCVQALAAALLAVSLARVWVGPAVLLAVAAGLWSARSHGASTHGVLGWSIDFVHLVVGTAWAGSLVLTVWTGWRLRRRREPWLPLVHTYAGPALGFVIALGIAGVVASVELLPSWAALFDTGYGRLIILKAALFAAAIALAAAGRQRGLRAQRPNRLRRTMTAEGLVVVGALTAAAVLVNGAPPQPASAASELLGPPPLAGPVTRDAGLAGQLNVEVAADGERLDVRVFAPSGPVRDTDVDVTTQAPDGATSDLVPRPCGPGCYTQSLALGAGVTTVTVTAAAPDWTGGDYEAQLTWPPGTPAADLLGRIVARMRRIPQLTVTETVTSGPGSRVAPATATISGEAFIAAEPYAGANLDDVYLLPGEPQRLALYLPGSQIYATLQLDDAGRIAAARLVTRGHEITRTFSYPDP